MLLPLARAEATRNSEWYLLSSQVLWDLLLQSPFVEILRCATTHFGLGRSY